MQIGRPFLVLDDGFVRAIDYMGSDDSIVQAMPVWGSDARRSLMGHQRALRRRLEGALAPSAHLAMTTSFMARTAG